MPITDCLRRGGAVRDPSRFALSRLVWLCRDDHLWVESHRLLAYGLGLLVRHGVTPCSEIPVFHHGRWVLLDDNGGVLPVKADSQGLRSRHESHGHVAIDGGDRPSDTAGPGEGRADRITTRA